MIFDIFTTNMTREYTHNSGTGDYERRYGVRRGRTQGKVRRPMSTLQMLVEPHMTAMEP